MDRMDHGEIVQRRQENDPRPLLGCFPLYPPLELFHAMGLLPVVLWGLEGVNGSFEESDKHLQSYSCSVARCLVQYILSAPSGSLDGLFMYNACDTLRNLPEIIESGLQEKGSSAPFFKLHLPMTIREQVDGSWYLKKRISKLVRELEQQFGSRFDEEKFLSSVKLYKKIRELCCTLEKKVAAGEISYTDFSECLRQNFFLIPEEQLLKLQTLNQQRTAPAQVLGNNEKPPGVVISGILAPPTSLLKTIEATGLRVVGNDVAAQRRWYGCQPDITADPLQYYRALYSDHYPCPTLLYTADERVDRLLGYIKSTGAVGVIFAAEKFCEYEYFEYPYLQRRLQEIKVSSLVIELSADDFGQTAALKTRLEAFAEMLKG